MSETEKKKGGRPTLYRKEYSEQARKLCLLGFTDKRMADFFDVSENTIANWKKEHEEFLRSVTRGKDIADAEVANSFYERCIGYSHGDTHISNYQGEITVTPIVKHYPPDSGAALNWLKNRQPKLWRDKHDLQLSTIDDDGEQTGFHFVTPPKKDDTGSSEET